MDEELTVTQPGPGMRPAIDQVEAMNTKPALVEHLQAQISNIATFLLDALLDRPLDLGVHRDTGLAVNVSVNPSVAPEDVFVDLAQRKILLEDLAGLVQRADAIDAAGQAFILEASQADQFFNETFLKEAGDQLARETLGIGVDQRQTLDQQEEVFAAERQKLVGGLIEALAPGEEKTLQEVSHRLDNLEQQLADLPAQVEQAGTEQERSALHNQGVALEAQYDQYRTLEWLAKTIDYNQQCLDTLKLLQELRPELPVILNGEGVPIQLTQANCVGEAYASEAAARAAVEAEHQRRLGEEAVESQRKEPHILHVEIRDREQNAIAEWWEVSEHGQLEKEGHTEQKMATRIDFEVMQQQDYSLHLEGVLAPCAYDRGCDLMLDYYAKEYAVPIEYFDQHDMHRYPKP